MPRPPDPTRVSDEILYVAGHARPRGCPSRVLQSEYERIQRTETLLCGSGRTPCVAFTFSQSRLSDTPCLP